MLARRNGMEVHKKKILHQDFCSRSELDVLTVFQYMIGNTDWSVSAFHNIKRIFRDDSTSLPIAVPYDFDYAGAIASHYAAPHESLSITNVRQRLFRGFCRPQGEYEKTMTYFNEKKVEIYAVYGTLICLMIVIENQRSNILIGSTISSTTQKRSRPR